MAVNPVSVTVKDQTTAEIREITVSISRNTICLGGEGNGNVPIQWNIDQQNSTPGWTFDANGIEFAAASASKFDVGGAGNGPSNSNKRFTCTRKNSMADNTMCKYSVKVTDGATRIVIDPVIINEP